MDFIFYLGIGFFWFVIFGAITSAVAKSKGQEQLPWFIFGGLLFIVALPLVLLAPAKGAGRNAPSKTCPYCGAKFQAANRCPECGRGQPDFGTASVGSWERTVTSGDDVEKWAKRNSPDDPKV